MKFSVYIIKEFLLLIKVLVVGFEMVYWLLFNLLFSVNGVVFFVRLIVVLLLFYVIIFIEYCCWLYGKYVMFIKYFVLNILYGC